MTALHGGRDCSSARGGLDDSVGTRLRHLPGSYRSTAAVRLPGPLRKLAHRGRGPGDRGAWLPTGRIDPSFEGTYSRAERSAHRQATSCQVRHGPTTGVGAAVGRHEMPGLHPPLGVHPHQKILGLRALERDGSEVAVPIPGEDLGQRPPAEPAVIVEQDHSRLHAHRVEEHRHLVRDPVCSSTRKEVGGSSPLLEASNARPCWTSETLVSPWLSASYRGTRPPIECPPTSARFMALTCGNVGRNLWQGGGDGLSPLIRVSRLCRWDRDLPSQSGC